MFACYPQSGNKAHPNLCSTCTGLPRTHTNSNQQRRKYLRGREGDAGRLCWLPAPASVGIAAGADTERPASAMLTCAGRLVNAVTGWRAMTGRTMQG